MHGQENLIWIRKIQATTKDIFEYCIDHLYFHSIAAPPLFLVKPSDTKVLRGDTAKLECIAAGNPAPTLFWMKEGGSGVLLPGSSQERVTVSEKGTISIGKRKKKWQHPCSKSKSTEIERGFRTCVETWLTRFLGCLLNK